MRCLAFLFFTTQLGTFIALIVACRLTVFNLLQQKTVAGIVAATALFLFQSCAYCKYAGHFARCLCNAMRHCGFLFFGIKFKKKKNHGALFYKAFLLLCSFSREYYLKKQPYFFFPSLL